MEEIGTCCRKTVRMSGFTFSHCIHLPQHIFLHAETREALQHDHARSYPAQSNHLGPSRPQTLLLLSSCNLQRLLFVKGEEPWLWPYFSYRVAVASGKFYVQLLLMRWQAEFSIISQEFAAQFTSEEHFQSFYMMMLSSETCSCCYETNLFLPVRQIYSRDLELLSLDDFSEIIQYFSYCFAVILFFLSLTFGQMNLDSGPLSVLFDVSSFLAYTKRCILGYTCLTKHKEVKQGRKFKLMFKCSASPCLIKKKKKKPIT